MYLLKNSEYVATDSWTVVEEACIIGIPSIQMRFSTERPEVYDVNASINFDPTQDYNSPIEQVTKLIGTNWNNPFGDGNSSEIIVKDLKQLSKDTILKNTSLLIINLIHLIHLKDD